MGKIFKGVVRNHSSKVLWVIEGDTAKSGFVAHKLLPDYKSLPGIDVDGVKRYDGKAIQGHKDWWKISDFSFADVVDKGNDLDLGTVFKTKADLKKDGKEYGWNNVKYIDNETWGIPIKEITRVRENKKGTIISYHIEGIGWVKKTAAISMAKKGLIENVTVAKSSKGNLFLRTLPDQENSNNLSSMS